MSTENHEVVANTHRLTKLRSDALNYRDNESNGEDANSNMVTLSRRIVTSQQMGVISENELKHIVTTQFDYPPLRRNASSHSDSLVAAFNPYSAKGRAIRYLAARIMLEAAAGQSLCFSVAAAERKSGASFIAANLAVAYSEFGLRTLLIDANLKRPKLHQLFDCKQKDGLSTIARLDTAPECFVFRLEPYRDLSLLPAGRSLMRMNHRLTNEILANRLHLVRPHYDVVICDSPALATRQDDCEVVAGICGSALTVFRRDHTRLSKARALLASLDAVGTRQIGSVLCDF
jgi:receptor protein-tyrosine kinase